MTDALSHNLDDDYLTTVASLGLVAGDAMDALRVECSRSGLSPREFLIEQRRLDTVEIDIVDTLRAPDGLIPGYRIEGLLGRGGMGVVYRALQQNLNRTVALKTILVSRMTDSSVLDRFEQEAHTIGKLRHPNIIAAHDFGRSAGRLFLAMELVEGIDLERRLAQSGPFTEDLAWGLARQAASGLAHADRHKIVHRDLKPANLVLVDPPEGYPLPAGMPMVKIADFGLALLTADVAVETRLTADRTTLGSPHYMAPEQLESSSVDIRADIYALGATVYHALAGQAPFAGLNLPQLVAAKLQGRPHDLSELAPGLQPTTYRLVERLMSRNPAERPGSYTELLSEIDNVLRPLDATQVSLPATGDGSPPPVKPPTTKIVMPAASVARTHILPRMRRRKSWRPILATVAAVVAGVIVAYAVLRPAAPIPLPATPVASSPAGATQVLFNGENVGGWTLRSGGWSVLPDTALLSGTNGVIERVLFVRGDGQASGSATPRPLEWYRLELLLQPTSAEGKGPVPTQDVHFGLAATQARDGARYVLQANGTELVIGSRDADQAEFGADARIAPVRRRQDRPTAVTIERLPNGWFVSIDERQVAGLPLRPGGELPEFRLGVEGGTAEFSDLVVTELRLE